MEGTQYLDQQWLVAASLEELEKDGGARATFGSAGGVAVGWSSIGAG